MAVLFNDQVYLFELKTVEKEPEGTAMAQIEEKGYADKYPAVSGSRSIWSGGVQP